MAEMKHVVLGATEMGGAWFNFDFSRFAMLPRDMTAAVEVHDGRKHANSDVFDDELARTVEELVETFLASGNEEIKDEVVRTLIELHAQRRVVWPMTLLFGASALTNIGRTRGFRVIGEFMPALAEMREVFETAENVNYSNWGNRRKKGSGFNVWKTVMACRFASTAMINVASDFKNHHIEAVCEVARPNGLWDDRLPAWMRAGVVYTANYYQSLGDPTFGAVALRHYNPPESGVRKVGIATTHSHLKWLDDDWERYLDAKKIINKKSQRSGKNLLLAFLVGLAEARCADANATFSRQNMRGLLAFAKDWGTPLGRFEALKQVRRFNDWLSAESSDDSGVLTVDVALCEADTQRFFDSLPITSGSNGVDVAARPMPMLFHQRLREIIIGHDFAWPKSLKDRNTGQLTHYTRVRKPDGTFDQVFCEVLPRMLLLHLDLPLRNVQIRRLDSGEGDDRWWDQATETWKNNTGPNSGHWRRTKAKNARRGVFREFQTQSGHTITGLWINSNKTQDRGTLFDETSGYEIPWENREVLENLHAMRVWQETHNPVARPIAYDHLRKGVFKDEPSAVIRPLLPDRFYLFRYPNNHWERGNECPPSYELFVAFFHDALEELESRYNEENPDRPIKIITKRNEAGQPTGAVFTIHGMRSASLTGLHKAGVPIGVISKLVAGHASILMTLKYLKYDPQHVNDVLRSAQAKVAAQARADFPNFLSKLTYEQVVRRTARLSDEVVGNPVGWNSDPLRWSRMDIGLCPNGGTMCHIGGEIIRQIKSLGKDKSAYAEVRGGPRNCVQCRFFETGFPYLIPLVAKATSLAARVAALGRQSTEHEERKLGLKKRKEELRSQKRPVPPDLNEAIGAAEEAWMHAWEAQDMVRSDLAVTNAYIEKVRAIGPVGTHDDSLGSPLPVLHGDQGPPLVEIKEASAFEVNDSVVQSSRHFPSLASADVERERNSDLDKMLFHSGLTPITMLPFSAAELRSASDALSEEILRRARGDAGKGIEDRVEDLIAGRVTLADLGLVDVVQQVSREKVGTAIPKLGPSLSLSSVDLLAAE